MGDAEGASISWMVSFSEVETGGGMRGEPSTCRVGKTESVSGSVVSDPLRPHGLSPTRLLRPWHSPGKNTRVGCRFLLQGIFPT